MNQRNNVRQIDLLQLFMACVRRWWFIAIVTIICGAVAFVYTYQFVTPMYQATVKMYINNSDVSVGNISISTSDLSASIQLVDLYAVILNTKDTLDEVIEAGDLDMSYVDLKDKLSTSSVNDTQVFSVTVKDADPILAEHIASTIGDVLPDVIENIVNGSEAKIVEHAIVPAERSSPSYSSATAKGLMVGFVLSIAVIVVYTLMDTTIKSDADVLRICDTAILAYIPNLSGEKSRRSYYNYYNRKKYYKSYQLKDQDGQEKAQ